MVHKRNPLKIAALIVQGPLLVRLGTVGDGRGPGLLDYSIPNLSAASRLCQEYLQDMKQVGMPAEIWAGGEVLRDDDDTRECVAVVGTDGRVWLPGELGAEGRREPDLEQEYDLTWDT